jgi:peptidoglycan/xylan/chitin deacetylase (PgdA/CDA1 family)
LRVQERWGRSYDVAAPRVAGAAVLVWQVVGALWLSCMAPAASGRTVVSLSFDDGTATQFQAGQMLAEHGMHATFYVNSSEIGASDYHMTWPQIHQLAAYGNEIGGHTAHHVNLAQTDPTEARRQICQDRENLLDQGFTVRTFAYPYGVFDASIERMVRRCGYLSARTSNTTSAETIPPADPYAIREVTGTGESTGDVALDLAALEKAVTQAEQTRARWIPITFHQICHACESGWIDPADLQAFLDWLQPRAASGTVVRTVGQVIRGPVQPAVDPPPRPAAPNGVNGLRNPSLEADADADGVPDCYRFDGYGINSARWTRIPDAHTGAWAERVDVTNYQDGDNKLLVDSDLGYCTPTVAHGHQYIVTAWYKSTAPVSFAAFNRDSLGAFAFWDSSDGFPPASTWTQATWTTPVIPDGTNGLTFGLALSSNGSLTVDDLGLDDAAPTSSPETRAPTVSVKLIRTTLRQLVRSGKLGVTLAASQAAKLVIRARVTFSVKAPTGSLQRRTKLIAFANVSFAEPGSRKVMLRLSRGGMATVKRLRRAKLTVSAAALDAAGGQTTTTASTGLRA